MPRDEAEEIGSQQRMIDAATQRAKAAVRYQRGKGKRHIAGRNLR
jgi:hypothetical protein